MSSETLLKTVLSGPFTFSARPSPLAGDLRMSWGIAILILILFYSRGKKGSLKKIQLLAHTTRIREGREDLEAYLSGKLKSADLSLRIEPWLNRAVNYSYAMKLICLTSSRSLALTDEGLKTANEIVKSADVLVEEKCFLERFAPTLTERRAEQAWQWEGLF